MAWQKTNHEIPTMADKDKYKKFVCPYNTYHSISAMRYPSHVANCRKQYTGKAYKQCPFNARHEFPAVEYDWHISVCPDKHIMERELSRTGFAPNVHPLNHSGNDVFDSEEDWESEANHFPFSIGGNPYQEQMTAYDIIEEFHLELERKACSNVSPEPTDDRSNDDAGYNISGGYDIAARRHPDRAFVDWVSVLNQYCQKHRLNYPKYYEATNPHGGFGSSVVVSSERYFSDCFSDTKKKAKQCAARAALLGLNIPISEAAPCRAPHQSDDTDIERARELSMQASLLSSRISRPQRVIPGLNAVSPPTSAQATQATPSNTASRHSPQNSTSTSSMVEMTIQDEEGEWKVTSRRQKETRSTGNIALRSAGIGRGRGRK